MSRFGINIIGLGFRAHAFEYRLNDSFFEEFGKELVAGGEFEVKVVLDKHETFIDADFSITGFARLVCDRSLEQFDQPLNIQKRIMFKYGQEAAELSDEIVVIPRDLATLELGQLIYEFIAIEIPMKKLHPRFRDEEKNDDSPGKIVYQSDKGDDNEPDPRWEKLKKLK
jgi:uncharacterized metal-binding protein YceD (DUF177 family)